MRRKIVLLIDDLHEWTGTEVHLLRLLKTIDRQRLDPVLAVVGRDELGRTFEAEGIPVVPLHIYRTFAPSGIVGIGKIVALLRRERAELLVTYHTAADLLGPIAARLAGVPVLSCRRDEGISKKPIHKKAQRFVNYLVTGIISNSHRVVQAVARDERFPRGRNQVVWNGEDLERFSPGTSGIRRELGLGDEACVIATISLLSAVKDHSTQLRALERVVRRHPDTCLLVAGDGPERARLEREAEPLGDRVRFLGHRRDVVDILRASDIYLQISLSEGFSNSILQAMAVEVPVVVTRVGGNPELVDASCGLLVPARAPSEVAEALETLIADPALRRRLGAAGRARAKRHFSIDVMTEGFTDAFERAIEGRFPGPSSGA
jgi:glycosyltransferase involved in cell wall biosynthesis